jgi:natural product precursor
MKKLNKLQINSEKLMNNEELITLRGGYGNCSCACTLNGEHMAASSESECKSNCKAAGLVDGVWTC